MRNNEQISGGIDLDMQSSATKGKFIQQTNTDEIQRWEIKYFRQICHNSLAELTQICGQATRKASLFSKGNSDEIQS